MNKSAVCSSISPRCLGLCQAATGARVARAGLFSRADGYVFFIRAEQFLIIVGFFSVVGQY
jgi:hypothetical protein